MKKIFDKREWSFLNQILCNLGLSSNVRNLILQYITTISYKFITNEIPSEDSTQKKGLRQGDHFSLYFLFILYTKALSRILVKLRWKGSFMELKWFEMLY